MYLYTGVRDGVRETELAVFLGAGGGGDRGCTGEGVGGGCRGRV